jgi:N-acetylglutamate synthase-like GNAT family acetyltransferase
MPKTLIRKAKKEDIPALLPLMEQLGYPQDLQKIEESFALFISQKDYGIAVAEQEGRLVGWVAWSKSMSFVTSKARIRIEGLVVDTPYRGQGLGKKLMIYVEDVAKHFSPCIIELTSGLRRAKDGSHKFYQTLGYHNEGFMAKLYLRKEV